MKEVEAYHLLKSSLQSLYSEREAGNIANIVFEDAFDCEVPGNEIFKSEERLRSIISELLSGKPWQYVLGEADFYGLKIDVNEHVLIPRPETEELVYLVLEQFKRTEALHILDIGTGSGCIPVALKKNWPLAVIDGLDVSTNALAVAQRNATKNGVEIQWLHRDILDRKCWKTLGAYDVIVSNPPYITESEASMMQGNVKNFEPSEALFVKDDDPLVFYKAIKEFSEEHLMHPGWLFLEINEFLGKEVLELFANKPGYFVELIQDISGKDRLLKIVSLK